MAELYRSGDPAIFVKPIKVDSSFEVVPSVIFRDSGLYNVVIDGNVIAVSRVGSALSLDKEE